MFKIIFDSFTEIKKQRLKNPLSEHNATPFAGAFLIAFIIINWKLFYTIFNLESGLPLDKKIECISKLLNEITWTTGIAYPLLCSFISILFYYSFNNLSLVITTFFNSWVKPFILKMIDKSKIVTREVHNQLQDKLTQLSISYEELNKTFSESRADLEKLKGQLNDKEIESNKQIEVHNQLQDQFNKLSISNEELNKTYFKSRDELEKLKEQLIDYKKMNENLELERDRLIKELDSKKLYPEINEELLNSTLSAASLQQYTITKFPGLSVSAPIQKMILEQINLANYPTIRYIDNAVNSSIHALVAYKLESPTMFESGTDYISKALGFTDGDFRKKHGFSQATREAFNRYGKLVKRQPAYTGPNTQPAYTEPNTQAYKDKNIT